MQLNMPLLQQLFEAFIFLNWAERSQSAKPVLWFTLGDHLQPSDPKALPVEWRQAALERFQRAAVQLPDEPWIWFQIGWHSFAFEDGPRDFETARVALQRVLELDPDNAPAHLALAWLLFQERLSDRDLTSENTQLAWDGLIGEHFRHGLNREQLSEVWRTEVNGIAVREEEDSDPFYGPWRWPEFLGFEPKDRDSITHREVLEIFQLARWFHPDNRHPTSQVAMILPFLPTWGGHSAMVQALEALEVIVPDDHRFAHCMAHATVAAAREVRARWYEEALRYPTEDQLTLTRIHYELLVTTRDKGDVVGSFEHGLALHKLLSIMPEYDQLYDPDSPIWWPAVIPKWRDDLPEKVQELYLRVADAALDTARRWHSDGDALFDDIGEIVATAAQLAWQRNELSKAREYANVAREIEEMLKSDPHYLHEIERDGPQAYNFSKVAPDNWCVVAARVLRDIHLHKDNYQVAAEENNRILALLHGDRDALDMKLKLAPILEQRHTAVGLAELVAATRTQPQLPVQTVSLSRSQ